MRPIRLRQNRPVWTGLSMFQDNKGRHSAHYNLQHLVHHNNRGMLFAHHHVIMVHDMIHVIMFDTFMVRKPEL